MINFIVRYTCVFAFSSEYLRQQREKKRVRERVREKEGEREKRVAIVSISLHITIKRNNTAVKRAS